MTHRISDKSVYLNTFIALRALSIMLREEMFKCTERQADRVAEQSRAERGRVGQSRAEQRRMEKGRAEQNRVEQSREEQRRAEKGRTSQSRGEQGRAEETRRDETR